MTSAKTPIIAIVGRANVGKSSIFNSILRERRAIVANEPGTTRDAVWAKASWNDKDFWLVDTAGVKTPEDDFEFTTQEQIEQASDSADIIWMAIESFAKISDQERRLAKQLLKTKKPVFLLVNKADKSPKADRVDYLKLGIKNVFLTSATQNRGFRELLVEQDKIIPKTRIKSDKDRVTFAILGRPNVGKSLLFNRLAKKQQAIVADLAGTTRDINRVSVKYNKKQIDILDTAGIRRSGKIERGIERFSVIRSLSAIEQADVCALVMDANELNTQLDQKIAGMIKEAGKGLIIIVSKWDLVEKDAFTRDNLAPDIKHSFTFVPWAPLIFTSSVSGQNITKIFDLITDIHSNRQTQIKTPQLNRWLHRVVNEHPPAGLKNKTPKLNYIVQEKDNPTNFKVYGHDTKFLHWSYKRFLERRFREEYGMSGTPIRFWFFDNSQ